MSKQFTPAEVAEHKTDDSLFIIVDSVVYDVTTFINEHPGGQKILKRVAGKDASKQFWKVCLWNQSAWLKDTKLTDTVPQRKRSQEVC
jgi:cytochrome b involved in lipid metabolism